MPQRERNGHLEKCHDILTKSALGRLRIPGGCVSVCCVPGALLEIDSICTCKSKVRPVSLPPAAALRRSRLASVWWRRCLRTIYSVVWPTQPFSRATHTHAHTQRCNPIKRFIQIFRSDPIVAALRCWPANRPIGVVLRRAHRVAQSVGGRLMVGHQSCANVRFRTRVYACASVRARFNAGHMFAPGPWCVGDRVQRRRRRRRRCRLIPCARESWCVSGWC